ncbi:NADH-quinone oxidoreductase subunit C [Thiothrix litoralis]|jgi:NADH-quinone oxidoreductase subunit C|uniref:NADH-quinone oxidoreductase subunit C n=1 Tax=Thiothrix litoralis TaxID=2891210 RepID=UPI003C709299
MVQGKPEKRHPRLGYAGLQLVMVMQALYDTLKQRFPLGEFTAQRDNLAFITLEAVRLYPLLRYLRDHEGFSHLVLLTAVDWLEEGQFQLTYLLNNRAKCQDVGLRVMIPRDQASMESIHDLWPAASTYQRELREMFGIDFPGSPRVNEEFILEGWNDMPPYRRDFDTLEYARKTYRDRPGRETRDPAAHMKQQLYGDKGDV